MQGSNSYKPSGMEPTWTYMPVNKSYHAPLMWLDGRLDMAAGFVFECVKDLREL